MVAEIVPAGAGRQVSPMPPVVHKPHCVEQLAHLCQVTASDGSTSVWCLFCGGSVTRLAGALWAPQS